MLEAERVKTSDLTKELAEVKQLIVNLNTTVENLNETIKNLQKNKISSEKNDTKKGDSNIAKLATPHTNQTHKKSILKSPKLNTPTRQTNANTNNNTDDKQSQSQSQTQTQASSTENPNDENKTKTSDSDDADCFVTKRTNKIPPIDVWSDDPASVQKRIEEALPKFACVFSKINKSKFRVFPRTSEMRDKVIEFLSDRGYNFNTYTPADEKYINILIKKHRHRRC